MREANKGAVNPWLLAAVMLGLLAVLGGMNFLKGALYLGKHEGDTLHLADMVLRMAEAGQWPHLDFMTPIGVLALWPIAAFVEAGLGIGHAFFAAQMAVAVVLLLPAMRVASSRFTGVWALLFGGYIMVLCVALVHGEADASVSISMHYNRWAWALAYIAIPLALLAPIGRVRPWLDGALIGLAMAALVLVKVTYFVAFAPAVLIALLARRQGRMIVAALLSGLLVAAIVTFALGAGFWLAYLRDLAQVSGSSIRPEPGQPLTAVMGGPGFIAGTFALLATVIFLRQSGRMVEGMVLLFLTPGFIYVTWQNFGNDPQWLLMLALFAFSLRPDAGVSNAFGWSMRNALMVTGVMALTLGAASVLNLAFSPFRHFFMPEEKAVALLSARPKHADLLVQEARLYRVATQRAGDEPGSAYATFASRSDRADPAKLNGEVLADCELIGGYNAWFETATADLMASGYRHSQVLVADLFSALWLYGDFLPVRGGAPWYYGGVAGIEAADHVLVPLCPTGGSMRTGMLKALDDAGWHLTEERRTETYILLKPTKG
ncbi:hypothetical protein [Phaeovulum sp.]|uniref:hypothetical protein n=1 Tax=Phaeovulum sp. TaxID=2934796 RepID=UPI0039E21C86